METTQQQLLHAKLRTLRKTRTGEARRKAAAMAAEMDVDPMAMLDTLGLTPEEKAAVERAASTGSQADVQRALLKTQSTALGLGTTPREAAGADEDEDTDEETDEEAPPPVAPAEPAEPAEIVPRCAQITQRTVRRGAKKKAKKRGKRR